jgi:OCT family organic cation transporter-like MFS transporter 18
MYNVSFFLQMMLLPYIGKSIGMADHHFGYMQTAFGIVQMVGGPLFGIVCSRIGKPTMATMFSVC